MTQDQRLEYLIHYLLAEREEKKRFLTVEDIRLPGQLVFFRSAQWAGFFAAATGLDARQA